ncbi:MULTISPECIES: hypothetical protein [unclassified Pedobacter]|jgi:hypothetical protein|uniref:hypothetical protein n=1 Tax=unclassified Pedobacter TaxID=2628915 RepID=UPI000B4AD91D|nr:MULTISPECIES: hypothetical protein [unclassified Pedobacter]MCX2429980.1 hypothetical protein [Pedobacter sp. GR22-10]MCX2585451.1 hypothetical protein [Pedobacter sp. MR22-3]OWK70653.1 hypothetical protein CBW18_05990 [Pedobacter sp. AJM]
MPIHRGKLLKSIIQKSDISIFDLSKALEYSIDAIHHHIEMETLDFKLLLAYGEVLKYDFSVDFPEMKSLTAKETFNIEVMNYDELLKDRDHWKLKYIQLLEKHNELLIRRLNFSSSN